MALLAAAILAGCNRSNLPAPSAAAAARQNDEVGPIAPLRRSGVGWRGSDPRLAIVVFSVANTIMMSIFERTREIGTLMAIGTTRARLWRMFLAEGFAIRANTVGHAVSVGHQQIAALHLNRFLFVDAIVKGADDGTASREQPDFRAPIAS